MKKLILYSSLFILFTSLNIYSQTNFSISGQIISVTQKNTDGIMITLVSANDNAIVKLEITDKDGKFEFQNLNTGSYKILIEEVNYKNYQSEIMSLSSANPKIQLTPISLSAATINTLEEVVIKKKKNLVENKVDRTVINVEALITAAGGDAMDVLEKSPGIVVDQNGTITFKGKTGVQVFIDDKPTYLSGSELEAYLKSLPASTLDKIELMTNPPAKYDAAGNAGIINIVSKKSKARGFNGNITSRYSQGRRANTREGININYMNDKIRIYGNIGYAFQHPNNDLFIFRKFKNQDGTTKSLFFQDSFLDNKIQTYNSKIGVDYYLSEKTTIGFGVSGLLKRTNQKSDVTSILTDANNVIDSTIIARNREKERFDNGTININLRHDIDSLGQKITVDLDYLKYDTATRQTFNNFIFQPNNSLTSQDELRGFLPSDIAIYSLKSDYTLPLKNQSTFEIGYKVSYTKTDNIADYRDVINGVEVPNFDTSNQFLYDEIINAAYVNFNTSYKRFTIQTGLRIENTESRGNQLGNIEQPASQFKRNYTSFFPTVFIQYNMDSKGNNQLVANYGRRINRPYFQDLNPFVSPLDRFTFYSGNPFLNPSFANNYELSYRYKQYFSTTISYGYATDEINETIEINNGIYFSRPANIGKSTFFSLNMNAEIPFTTWWSANAYSEITTNRFQSKLYTEELNASGTYWYFSMNNRFTFNKGWSGEISGTYQTDAVAAQLVLLNRSNINLGVQKRILKDKASIKFSVNDIFYGNINNGIIKNLQNTEANWKNRPDSRFVALTVTYGFGKSFAPKNQYDSNGADTEKNRVKT
jgi:hypothetical protein